MLSTELIIYPEEITESDVNKKSTNAVPYVNCIEFANFLFMPTLIDAITTGPGGTEKRKPVIIPTIYDSIILFYFV